MFHWQPVLLPASKSNVALACIDPERGKIYFFFNSVTQYCKAATKLAGSKSRLLGYQIILIFFTMKNN